MSDKNLTELEWKRFSKGRGYKDAAFVKALAALELGKTPEARLAALDEIEKQAEALRKAAKADKELQAWLDDAGKAAAKERRLQQAEAKKAASQAAATEEEDESPALLTSRMLPLLRQVPKGDTLHALVAVSSKDAAVLLSRRPVSPARRKLLTDYLGASGGVKFLPGECVWEQNAHTFVLQGPASGLAKKIRAALLRQVEQRFKVRVRGEDPNDIDDDGEAAEQERAEREGDEGGEGTGARADAPVPQAPPQPPQPPGSPAPGSYEAALERLLPRVKAALQGGQSPNATKIRALLEFAREKGAGGNPKAALAALEQLDKLLGAAASGAPAPQVPKGFVNQAQSRLAWQQLRRKVQQDLAQLEQAILAEYRDAEDFGDLAAKIRRFDAVLTVLDDSLSDTLDAALNATDMAERLRLHQQARGILARYIDFAASDPLLRALDNNPFVPLTTHATLVRSLQVLDKSLA